MRVADLDMREVDAQCPTGLVQTEHEGTRVCTKQVTELCAQTFFDTAVTFDQVCGMIIGYPIGTLEAFQSSSDIESNYIDGISLTYGSDPRQHIWSFAAAFDEEGNAPNASCQCSNVELIDSAQVPPSFVGNDYFCDAGGHTTSFTFSENDPLWNGSGCGPLSTCCSFNNPPWFFRQLPSSVIEAIEMRLCFSDNGLTDEEVSIEQIQIYIQ